MDCNCDEDYLCDRPECVAESEKDAVYWLTQFSASPPAYTVDDLIADRVYEGKSYKYGNTL